MANLSWIIASAVGIAVCVCAAPTLNNKCAGQPDGYVMEIRGCWEATICQAGNVTTLICPSNTVLERDSMTCKPIGEGNTACGTIGHCEGTEFKMYGDANCQTYYWCIGTTFLPVSRNYCSGDLLFDGFGCNYPWNVPPPCGTMIIDPPAISPESTTETPLPATELISVPTLALHSASLTTSLPTKAAPTETAASTEFAVLTELQ